MTKAAMPASTQTPSTSLIQAFANEYGFSRVELTREGLSPDEANLELNEMRAGLDAMAAVIRLATNLPHEEAKKLCGLRGRVGLANVLARQLTSGSRASFSPETFMIKVSSSHGTLPHFAHEWAHAMDMAIGGRPLAKQEARVEQGQNIISAILHAAQHSPSPYQEILGEIAKGRSDIQKKGKRFASQIIADPTLESNILESHHPAFSRLAKSLLPRPAKSMSSIARQQRQNEAALQQQTVVEFVASAAEQCLRDDENIRALKLSDRSIRALARFCSLAVENRSKRESVRRQGRESSIDFAKADIAVMLSGAFRMEPDAAQSVASSIFHIQPIKEQFSDPFYDAPYTGRGHWESPGSLADLSCALVRIHRNQRALENAKLSKEKFVPMAFWWSMRRHVSEIALQTTCRAEKVVDSLIDAGLLDSKSAEHAKQWASERGAYKAGAAVFSDLSATGVKMLTQEAVLMERELTLKDALALRKKITDPINQDAKRKTVSEAIAESFELFVLTQSEAKTPLGHACKKAIALGLVDNDSDENKVAMDPAVSWLNDKDGDIVGNQRRWRALLRELPDSLPAPPPRRMLKKSLAPR